MVFKRSDTGDKPLYCSFCGKEKEEVVKMIAGPSVHICNECVELCNDIIEEEVNPEELKQKENIEKVPLLAPFKNEGTVFFTGEITDTKENKEIHLTFNRVACLAFSNIFTQLAITDLEDEYSFNTKDLGYNQSGSNFKITVCD